MQNISKIIKVLISLILLDLLFIPTTYGASQHIEPVCNTDKKNGVYQEITSKQFGCIEFKFNEKSRIVSLRTKSPPYQSIVVKKIKHFYSRDLGGMVDFSPSLVGLEGNMGFISSTTFFYNGKEYLALIFYERSSGGNGGGECGAGANGYLVGYQLSNHRIKKSFSKLVDSCGGMKLEEFPKNPDGAIYIKNSYIYVDWSIHDKFGLDGAIGKIRVSDGNISHEKKPAELNNPQNNN